MAARILQVRTAWIFLVVAVVLHIVDEALNGFLFFFNSGVETIRTAHPWVPLRPTTFPVWPGILIIGIILLFALTPFVFRWKGWVHGVSIAFSALMIGNALSHIGTSLYQGRMVPGVYSSPFLLGAALAFLITAVLHRKGISSSPER